MSVLLPFQHPSKRWLHPDLQLERVLRGQTEMPFTTTDFIQYLHYTHQAHEVRYLFFSLWYRRYVKQWPHLSPHERSKSPRWDPIRAVDPEATKSHQRTTSHPLLFSKTNPPSKSKLDRKIGTNTATVGIPEETVDLEAAQRPPRPPPSRQQARPDILRELHVPDERDILARPQAAQRNFSVPRNYRSRSATFHEQPYRSQVNAIAAEYLFRSSPTALALPAQTRDGCIVALAETTHPSALLPAFLACERRLATDLFPPFVHATTSNVTRPWQILLQAAVFLILSDLHRVWRLLVVALMFPGFLTAFLAHRGLSLLPYWARQRQSQPWETGPQIRRSLVVAHPPLQRNATTATGPKSMDDPGRTVGASSAPVPVSPAIVVVTTEVGSGGDVQVTRSGENDGCGVDSETPPSGGAMSSSLLASSPSSGTGPFLGPSDRSRSSRSGHSTWSLLWRKWEPVRPRKQVLKHQKRAISFALLWSGLLTLLFLLVVYCVPRAGVVHVAH